MAKKPLHPRVARRREDYPEGSPGAQFAGFIAPTYRGMFLFTAAAVVAVVLICGAIIWCFHSATEFVDIRAKAVWAETALKAAEEHKQFYDTLNDHKDRLNKLEAASLETGKALIEIKNATASTVSAVNDIKSDIKAIRDNRK